MASFGLRISDETESKIATIARQRGLTRGALAAEAIDEFVARHEGNTSADELHRLIASDLRSASESVLLSVNAGLKTFERDLEAKIEAVIGRVMDEKMAILYSKIRADLDEMAVGEDDV